MISFLFEQFVRILSIVHINYSMAQLYFGLFANFKMI